MVGWAQIKAHGRKGSAVKLRFAERLNDDGSLYVENLRTALCTDTYIFKGEGTETWEPAFTYHGFRYVEVTGLDYKPASEDITGKVIYDEMENTGHIETSNKTINAILKNAFHGIRGNYRGMPTDCPQRDERQGWLGDRSVNSYGESFIFNNNLFYTKWITDIADAQNDSGAVPNVAPPYLPHYWDNMTFPASIIIIPGHMYHQFGNLQVIADNYNVMKKYLDYMRGRYMKNYLLCKDVFGDWCMPPEGPKIIWSSDPKRITPGDYLGSVYYYYSLKLMNQYASLLNKNDEAVKFLTLSDSVKTAINNTFFNRDSNYYANNTITANALALYHGLVPDGLREKVFKNVVDKTVNEYNSHISTGLVGSQWIMRTLSDNGRPDLAFKMASNTDYPGWGYMIENGATTIWELWNGNTADPKMNSGNHVMLLGDFVVWCYEYIAGIKSDSSNTGFSKIIMNPLQVDGLDYANSSYKSVHGLIKSNWKKESGNFTWDILIPANTFAEIHIPAADEHSIFVNGKSIKNSSDTKLLSYNDGKAVIQVSSGKYTFTSKTTK
jgi:alpha-L-rhamnosidase